MSFQILIELNLFLTSETDSIDFLLRLVQCQLLGQPTRECRVLNALQSAHWCLMMKGTGPATGLCAAAILHRSDPTGTVFVMGGPKWDVWAQTDLATQQQSHLGPTV